MWYCFKGNTGFVLLMYIYIYIFTVPADIQAFVGQNNDADEQPKTDEARTEAFKKTRDIVHAHIELYKPEVGKVLWES